MTLRHVETLRDLGFDAVCRIGRATILPAGVDYTGPIDVAGPIALDDVLVLPADAPNTLDAATKLPNLCLIFVQDKVGFLANTLGKVEAFDAGRRPGFIAPAPNLVATILRVYPKSQVSLIPAFADERLFRPGPLRRRAVAYTPRKRPQEVAAIRNFFRELYPERTNLSWIELVGASERQVADAFGEASLHLSLNRMESGITSLEAMAAGCLCAGFAGVGGWQYATKDNGFWVPDDDCEAAVDALAQADDVAQTGGKQLALMAAASRDTARRWSYAAFREALEITWMQLAPGVRLRNGPLD